MRVDNQTRRIWIVWPRDTPSMQWYGNGRTAYEAKRDATTMYAPQDLDCREASAGPVVNNVVREIEHV